MGGPEVPVPRPPTRSTAPRSGGEKIEDALSLLGLGTLALLYLTPLWVVTPIFLFGAYALILHGASGGAIVLASVLIVVGLIPVGLAALVLPNMLRAAAASTSLADRIRRMEEVTGPYLSGDP